MKKTLNEGRRSFIKLVHFLTWYGMVVAAVFYLLPIAGLLLESQYEALSSTARFFSVIGFFAIVTAWHVVSTRDRLRSVIL